MASSEDSEFWELINDIDQAVSAEENPGKDDGQEQMLYRNYSNRYGRDVRNYSNGYGQGQPVPPQEPAPPVPPIHAYNADNYKPVAGTSAPAGKKPAARKTGADAAAAATKPKKKKHRRKGLIALLVVLALLGGIIGGLGLFIQAPKTDAPIGPRKPGVSTVLLCGADLGDGRTDTMMLLYVDSKNKQAGLLTLPRDTYTQTSSGLDVKLNSAYGRNDGGTEGMEALLDYVQRIIGYRPDGYMKIDLDLMGQLVDLMGGVDFDVPTTISFEQSEQHDEMYLEPGMQHLNGAQALALLRFRYGYYNQDIGRQDTQKAFLKACMQQWLKPGNLGKLKTVMNLFEEQSLSTLSTGNYLWFATQILRCGISDIYTETLPGYADYIGDQSFYILYPEEVAELVNEKFNPYQQPITVDDLEIVTAG